MNFKVLLILGMHRSGTSLAANIIKALGINFGKNNDLLAANEFNEYGHFEHLDILNLNNEILLDSGFAWCSEKQFDISLVEKKIAYFKKKAREIIEKNSGKNTIFCWKEPRTSILLPFWKMVLGNNINAVIVYRHPVGVMKSLYKRDFFSQTKSGNLYSLYYAHILKHIDFNTSTFISFEDLISRTDEEIERLEEFLTGAGFRLKPMRREELKKIIRKKQTLSAIDFEKPIHHNHLEIKNAFDTYKVLETLKKSKGRRDHSVNIRWIEKEDDLPAQYFIQLQRPSLPGLKGIIKETEKKESLGKFEKYYYGRILFLLGDLEKKEEVYGYKERFIKGINLYLQRENLSITDMLEIGKMYFEIGNYERSREFFTGILKGKVIPGGQRIAALHHLAEISREKNEPGWKNYTQALIDILKNRKNRSTQDTYTLGVYTSQINHTEACKWFRKVLTAADDLNLTYNSYFRLGEIYRKMNKKTWRLYTRKGIDTLIKKKKKTSWELCCLGIKNKELGNFNEGIKFFKRFLKINHDADLEPLVYIYLGDLNRWIKKKRWTQYYLKGIGLIMEKKWKSGIDMYRMASCLKSIGKAEAAKKWFTRLLQTTSDKDLLAGAHFHLGEIHYSRGDVPGSMSYFSRALQLNPFHRQAKAYIRANTIDLGGLD